jgi:hypothetical protein
VSLTEATTTLLSSTRTRTSENYPGSVLATYNIARVYYPIVEIPKDPKFRLGLKRAFIPDDSIYVQTRTEEEPERKRPRGDTFMYIAASTAEGTGGIQLLVDKEPEPKQL